MRARSKDVLKAVVFLNLFLVFSAVAFSQAPAPEQRMSLLRSPIGSTFIELRQ